MTYPSVNPSPEATEALPVPSSVGRVAFDVDETADKFGCSRSTVYEWMKAGYIRSFKIGSRRFIPVTEIQRLLAEAK